MLKTNEGSRLSHRSHILPEFKEKSGRWFIVIPERLSISQQQSGTENAPSCLPEDQVL